MQIYKTCVWKLEEKKIKMKKTNTWWITDYRAYTNNGELFVFGS